MNGDRKNNNDEKDYYEDDADYYYNSALKLNTKDDAGATRFNKGRIPVYKLKLEDESEIPEKPKDILIEPNRKHYDKLIKEVEDQINHHQKSIDELIVKIKNEKYGNNPEITKTREERDKLREQLEPVKKQILELEDKLKDPRAELAVLKGQKESLQKDLEVFKVEALTAEIKAIQHKLGFASVSVSDEKKLIDRKQRLEEQKPKVEKYVAIQAKIKKIHDSNDKIFTQLKGLNETKKQLNDKLKVLSTKLSNFLDNKKQNDPNIKNLELQKDNIYEEKKKCIKKKRELDDEYEDKLYAYREQQKLLKYIKEAVEKITLLKKKEEREKKRKEREAKENAENDIPETETKKVEEEPFAYEMYTCEWLATYFKNSIASKDNTQQAQTNAPVTSNNSKIDEDISKGLIKPISRQDKENEFTIALATSGAAKKKSKGPKVSKREQKLESSNLLTLDIGIIKKIQDIKLSPPSKKTDIPNFITLLEKTLNDFKSQASANKTETKPTQVAQTPKTEEVKKTEDKKAEDEEYEEVEITEEVEEEVEEEAK